MKFNLFKQTKGLPAAIVLFVLLVLPMIAATAQEKPVAISRRSIAIKDAIKEIEAQTGYVIGFRGRDVNTSKRVSLSRTNGSTREILGYLLADRDLTWQTNGDYIFITEAAKSGKTKAKAEPEPAPAVQSVAAEPVPQDEPEQMTTISMGVGHPAPVYKDPLPDSPAKISAYDAWRANAKRRLPSWAVKTNLLYDATATFNLGMEWRLGRKTTFELPVSYNPWTFSDNMKWKHFLVQPEFRWWTCEAFNGSFFGLHAHYALYNMSALPNPPFSEYMNTHRFEGWLVGAGISYGYHWILGKRWALEATVGAGYAYLSYDKFSCENCGEKLGSETKHYFGPTKAGVTLIFIIK